MATPDARGATLWLAAAFLGVAAAASFGFAAFTRDLLALPFLVAGVFLGAMAVIVAMGRSSGIERWIPIVGALYVAQAIVALGLLYAAIALASALLALLALIILILVLLFSPRSYSSGGECAPWPPCCDKPCSDPCGCCTDGCCDCGEGCCGSACDCGCGACDCGGGCDCGGCGGCGLGVTGLATTLAPAPLFSFRSSRAAFTAMMRHAARHLAHHPESPEYRADVFHLAGLRWCVGCFVTYPVFFLAVGTFMAVRPALPWWGFLVAGALASAVQVVSSAGWARSRTVKVEVKTCLGVGLAALVHGSRESPWPSAWRVAFLLLVLVLAGLSAVPRSRRMKRDAQRREIEATPRAR